MKAAVGTVVGVANGGSGLRKRWRATAARLGRRCKCDGGYIELVVSGGNSGIAIARRRERSVVG